MGLFVDIEKKLGNFVLSVSFDTDQTKGITGILGASGCGKSMTLKCIAGILSPDRGRIVLDGRVLFDSEKKISLPVQKRRVGYLFQNYALFPKMTVRENIEIAAPGKSEEYLRLLQIEALADHYPRQMSGGQQQRAALARTLAAEPEVLMLDEPFSALDYYMKEILQIDLFRVLRSYQGDVLMVTHSRDEVYRFCDQIHVLDQGRLVRSGPVKEVFAEPEVIAAARLTGCKNIAAVRKLTDHSFFVPDWDMTVTLNREVPDWAEAIGIRAHYLKPTEKGTPGNVLACRWREILEDPFEVTGIQENGVWWKVSKEEWNTVYRKQMPQYLMVPEESIFFLRETGKAGV